MENLCVRCMMLHLTKQYTHELHQYMNDASMNFTFIHKINNLHGMRDGGGMVTMEVAAAAAAARITLANQRRDEAETDANGWSRVAIEGHSGSQQ